MTLTVKQRVSEFEKEVLPAWEAAKILLDSHGLQAVSRATERVEMASKDHNEAAKVFWYKVLAILLMPKSNHIEGGHDS